MCTHAFLCDDTICKLFQPPYGGPYLVARHKNFTKRVNRNNVRIFIDQLKPADIASEEPGSTSAPTGAHLQTPTSQPASRYGCHILSRSYSTSKSCPQARDRQMSKLQPGESVRKRELGSLNNSQYALAVNMPYQRLQALRALLSTGVGTLWRHALHVNAAQSLSLIIRPGIIQLHAALR